MNPPRLKQMSMYSFVKRVWPNKFIPASGEDSVLLRGADISTPRVNIRGVGTMRIGGVVALGLAVHAGFVAVPPKSTQPAKSRSHTAVVSGDAHLGRARCCLTALKFRCHA